MPVPSFLPSCGKPKKIRILFITKARNNTYGTSFGLLNSEEFQASPGSFSSIVRALKHSEGEGLSGAYKNQRQLQSHNRKALKVWLKTIKDLSHK